MRLRTLDELSTTIRDDLAWRRKEIVAFESVVRQVDPGKRQAVMRGAVASLYANWEGFVRFAASAYLEYVRIRRLSWSQLTHEFIALAIRSRINAAASSNQLDSHVVAAKFLIDEWHCRASLPKSDVITVGGNLSARVFQSIVVGLGLVYRDEYRSIEKSVFDSLLNARNQLAHGEWQLVEQDDYDRYRKDIQTAMELFCASIEDAARDSQFMKVQGRSTSVASDS